MSNGWPQQDWDPTEPAVAADYLGAFKEMHKSCPVAWSDAFGGFWSVSRYDDVATVCKNPELYRNAPQFTIPHLETGIPWLPLQSDPPQHAQYRAVLQPCLARSTVLRLEAEMRASARALLGPLRERGTFDGATDFAQPYAGQALCLAMEFPREFWPRLIGWDRDIASGLGLLPGTQPDVDQLMAVFADIAGYVADEAERCRADPGDDFMSRLLRVRIDGRAISEKEMIGYYLLLMSAGHDTSSNSLTHAIVHLAHHPEHRDELLARPEIVPNAVEEIIRFYSPLLALARQAAQDTELGGRDIRAGDQIALLWGAAGHDTTHLPDADEFQLDRPLAKHLGFGVGTHYCVGAELGRLQLRVAIEEFLAAFDDFEIIGEVVKTSWPTNGYVTIPLVTTPASTADGLHPDELTG